MFTRRLLNATPRRLAVPQRRCLHSMPTLPQARVFQEEGVKAFLSAKAYDSAWNQYQRYLVDNLNRLSVGTTYENMNTMDIAITTARQADLAALFNYASQAHNNNLFFESLTGTPQDVPEALIKKIPSTFSSLTAMKDELLGTAMAMFGSGWVWLVIDSKKALRIMCTYNAGTPYGIAYRRQDTDQNTGQRLGTPSDVLEETRRAAEGIPASWARPLLVVNCWEHAWLQDYGVAGKREYLERWWEAVDWNVVAGRLGND